MTINKNIKKAYDELHRKNFIERVKKEKGNSIKVFNYKLSAPWHIITIEFLRDINLKGKKVLEIGCGYGSLSVYMAKKGARVTGIDISSEAIKISNINAKLNKQKVKFIQASATNTNFKDNSFDVVISCETLEHIHNYKKAIDEIVRITNKKGKILITTPNSINPKGMYLLMKSRQPVENFFSYWTIISEFKKRGIKIITIRSKSFLNDYNKENFFDKLINKTFLRYFSLRVGFLSIKE